MRFTMDAAGCLHAWCIDEAKNLPAALVNPILEVINAIFLLHFDIGRMSFRGVLRGHPVKLVNVHV